MSHTTPPRRTEMHRSDRHDRTPTEKQTKALALIECGLGDGCEVIQRVLIKGGRDNQADFLYRLMQRGWIALSLTEEGRRALEEQGWPSTA
jgi:hypothetical protein